MGLQRRWFVHFPLVLRLMKLLLPSVLIKQFVHQITKKLAMYEALLTLGVFTTEPQNDIFHSIGDFVTQTRLINSRPAA